MAIRLTILLYFIVTTLNGQGIVSNFNNHCATQEEKKLYNLITEYRISKQLPAIEFSKALSYVARVHAIDLATNRPDFGGCNPHSWSDKGNWKSCCYAEDENRVACMTSKPKELTTYKYKAFEAVYSGAEGANAEDAFELWKEINLTNDLLLNTGKWTKPWLAIGIGIYKEYACIWLGEGKDISGQYTTCTDTENPDSLQKSIISKVSGNQLIYHIITSSTSTLDLAKQEVSKLISRGYKNASYLDNTYFFRISLDHFKDEASAYKELEIIKPQFPDAWLLKPPALK